MASYPEGFLISCGCFALMPGIDAASFARYHRAGMEAEGGFKRTGRAFLYLEGKSGIIKWDTDAAVLFDPPAAEKLVQEILDKWAELHPGEMPTCMTWGLPLDWDEIAAATNDPNMCGCIAPNPKPCNVCDWWARITERVNA